MVRSCCANAAEILLRMLRRCCRRRCRMLLRDTLLRTLRCENVAGRYAQPSNISAHHLTPALSAAPYRSHPLLTAKREPKHQRCFCESKSEPLNRAATSSHNSSIRRTVSRSKCRNAQQHPHTAASATASRAATSSQTSVRSTVSRCNCRKS